MFVIKPEYVAEVLDRLCGSNLSGKLDNHEGDHVTTVGPQDNMYKFFDCEQMTPEEIEEMGKHRT